MSNIKTYYATLSDGPRKVGHQRGPITIDNLARNVVVDGADGIPGNDSDASRLGLGFVDVKSSVP